jgi:cell division protein FtsL
MGGGGVRKRAWLGFVLGVALLVAAVFGYEQWNLYQQTREIEELDVQILSSDLPIDAYLDRGFQTWLTRYQP